MTFPMALFVRDVDWRCRRRRWLASALRERDGMFACVNENENLGEKKTKEKKATSTVVRWSTGMSGVVGCHDRSVRIVSTSPPPPPPPHPNSDTPSLYSLTHCSPVTVSALHPLNPCGWPKREKKIEKITWHRSYRYSIVSTPVFLSMKCWRFYRVF